MGEMGVNVNSESIDSLLSPSTLNHIDSTCSSTQSQTPCSGVRRKEVITSGNTPSTESSNGTKKKIRSSTAAMAKPTSQMAQQQDYYNIWTARESYESNPEEMLIIEDLDVMPSPTSQAITAAPPLPPRNSSQLHRPLERSWPPRISRSNKPNSNDTFSFDIIDTDEPVAGSVDDVVCDTTDRIDFIPGEFFEERRCAGDGQVHRTIREELTAPLATPETDGSLSESNFHRMGGGMPKTPETVKLKPLLKKKIGPDNYISTILTQKVTQSAAAANGAPRDYSFPMSDQPNATGSEASVTTNCNNLVGEFIPLRPHRPLTRQLSSGNSTPKRKPSNERPNGTNSNNLSADDEVNRHFALCRKPPLRSPRQRSPPSGSSTRSASPMTSEQVAPSTDRAVSPLAHAKSMTKPQPRQLSQVNTTEIGDQLVCPPTPTHHARRLRSLSVSLGPPELRSRDLFTHERSSSLDSRQIDIFEPPSMPISRSTSEAREIGEGDEANHMHISSTRLPSIPESVRTAVANDEALPSAWEARMDSHGRIFYIDHATRSTSWQRPGSGNSGVLVGSTGRDQHRQQLDRRYQSIRRTINRRNDPTYSAVLPSQSRDNSPAPSTVEGGVARVACESVTQLPESDSHPAIKMLCRPDFYSKLHTNEDALTVYNRNAALKHMILRIRRDTSCFDRYQYNKDLVALVNCFALTDRELPISWDAKLDASGKQFFIDHTNRRTSFMDPRLPIDCPRIRQLQQQFNESQFDVAPIPPPRPALMPRPPAASSDIPVAYNDKVRITLQPFHTRPTISSFICVCLFWTGGRLPQTTEHSGNTQRTTWSIGCFKVVARENQCSPCGRNDSPGTSRSRFAIDNSVEVSSELQP